MTDLPEISVETVRTYRRAAITCAVLHGDAPHFNDCCVRAGLAAALVASGWQREADVLREAADTLEARALAEQVEANNRVMVRPGERSVLLRKVELHWTDPPPPVVSDNTDERPQWMIRDHTGTYGVTTTVERVIRRSWAQGITWWDPDGSYELCRRDAPHAPWEVVERHPVVSDNSEGAPMADPPGSVLRIEGDADIRTVMAGLDSLTVYGETRTQRQAAYDLLLRLRCRMGSDGRWRQGLPGDAGTVAS